MRRYLVKLNLPFLKTKNNEQRKRTKEVKTITSKQLIDRANRSDSDYKAGKIKTQEQLEIESQNW